MKVKNVETFVQGWSLVNDINSIIASPDLGSRNLDKQLAAFSLLSTGLEVARNSDYLGKRLPESSQKYLFPS